MHRLRASSVLVVLGCAVSGCAAERRIEPQAVDVRLGIVARALAGVEHMHAAAPPPSGSRRARDDLVYALDDALGSLATAEEAVHAWEHGDPRAWARVRPCLAANLERVDDALLALQWLPPPGLTQVVARRPLEPCDDPPRR